jgi:hypothetical protein
MNLLNIKYKPGMQLHNIRYRYPIASKQINDIMDGVYNDIVRLIGYEEDGTTVSSGLFDSLNTSTVDDSEQEFGDASSESEMLYVSSGTITDLVNRSMTMKGKVRAVTYNA